MWEYDDEWGPKRKRFLAIAALAVALLGGCAERSTQKSTEEYFDDLGRSPTLARAIRERSLQALTESGQLVRHVGRIMGYREDGNGVDVVIRRRGLDEVSSLRVDAVLNCSGSEAITASWKAL